MFSSSPSVVRVVATLALTSVVAGPLFAERWKDIGRAPDSNIHAMKIRIDLDALKQDGNLLTYRVEITRPNNPARAGWTNYSTSVIDCIAGTRRHLSAETFFPDGTVRRNEGANVWRKINEYDIAKGILADYCAPPNGSASR